MYKRTVYIGLGSNVGDRARNMNAALQALSKSMDTPLACSSLYRTDPVEVIDQEEFLNQVAGFSTDRTPEEILGLCLAIEKEMGRVRTRHKGPRVIDLDLLLAGSDIRGGGGIEVPHPRMHLRRFVLLPLCEIAPAARHPILRRSIAELLRDCPDRSRVEVLRA
jgi:2-amino-4-hydroxy-6-hydroxymethyldihydropteridine diphosphokinase